MTQKAVRLSDARLEAEAVEADEGRALRVVKKLGKIAGLSPVETIEAIRVNTQILAGLLQDGAS